MHETQKTRQTHLVRDEVPVVRDKPDLLLGERSVPVDVLREVGVVALLHRNPHPRAVLVAPQPCRRRRTRAHPHAPRPGLWSSRSIDSFAPHAPSDGRECQEAAGQRRFLHTRSHTHTTKQTLLDLALAVLLRGPQAGPFATFKGAPEEKGSKCGKNQKPCKKTANRWGYSKFWVCFCERHAHIYTSRTSVSMARAGIEERNGRAIRMYTCEYRGWRRNFSHPCFFVHTSLDSSSSSGFYRTASCGAGCSNHWLNTLDSNSSATYVSYIEFHREMGTKHRCILFLDAHLFFQFQI